MCNYTFDNHNLKLYASITGEGPAAILWPSIFTTHQTYEAFAQELSKRFTVISIDAPGFGKSVLKNDRVSMEQCVEATLDMLSELGHQQVTWIGTSWGGYIGTLAADLYPERITKLYTLGAPFYPEAAPKVKALTLATRFLSHSKVYSALIAWSFFQKSTLNNHSFMAQFYADIHSSPHEQIKRAVDLVFARRNSLVPQLSRISTPVTILASKNDMAVTARAQKRASKKLKNGYFKLIPGKHVVIADHPKEIAEHIA